jgi:F0F1-type ATP synthase membrane subunit b/b'
MKQWSAYAENLKAQYQCLATKYNEDAKRWNEYSVALAAENQRLSKWKNVADADVRAAEMAATARATLEKAKADADSLISAAQQRATALLAEADEKAAAQLSAANSTASTVATEAKGKAKGLKDEAQAILDSATTQAAKIIDSANKKAEEIGGSAYEAMKNAALYERTVKAMKNTIEGYGDEYIIPPHSLLDGLGDDFQHAQAGRELKNARDCTRLMIRNGTAAACEYVEANRRETAINFVVDAFNGKVDSILSRVKHDNAGKLEQEIRDAFTLVNFGGKAFREARITEQYLAARLSELKWAAVAQQLALQEREEQRYAKEQAREEARATKERERALREADRESEMMKKAMQQAEEQCAKATGVQKAMYEERLQEMAKRLQEMEEAKQRARSMAQQWKKGHVYIISNIGSFGEHVYKIGLTRRWNPKDRIDELGGPSVPFGFDIHAMILSDDAPALEQQLHRHFMLMQVNKENHRKEFFKVPLKQIREQIEKLGLAGFQWTLTAEAKEYRETLAIEKAIGEDPAEREKWIKRQQRLEMIENDIFEPEDALAD